MGKVKHNKSRAHYPAQTATGLCPPGDQHAASGDTRKQAENMRPPSSSFQNPFSGLSIDTGRLTPWTRQQLAQDGDPAPQSSSTSVIPEIPLTNKKDARRKLRHQAFLQKMNVSWRKEQEARKRAEKQKRQGNFFLQGLDDALPSLEDLVQDTKRTKKKRNVQQKPRLSQPHKAQTVATLADITSMQALLRTQAFQESPMVTVMESLQARLQGGL